MNRAEKALSTLLIAGGMGCNMDYQVGKLGEDPQSGLGSENYDEGDTNDNDTGYIDDTEDTGGEDVTENPGDDIPPYPFRDVINACMGLDESGCLIDLTEGTQVEACIVEVNAQITSMMDQLVASAREATGDQSITFEDIEDGYVPATVTASYNYDECNVNGNPHLCEYAWMAISFGDNREAHERDLWMPFEKTSIASLRCYTDRYADIDAPEEMEAFGVDEFVKPANDGDSSASLQIKDFAIYGSDTWESTTLEVYGTQYDAADPNLYTAPSFYELEEESEAITDVAWTLTGGGRNTTLLYQ